MFELLCIGDTLPNAYHKSLKQLKWYGEEVDCPDWNTKCKELSMTMIINKPMKEPMISKCFYGGPKELQQYCMEMLDGILDFEIQNGKWKYTYHDRMTRSNGGDQINFVIEELKRNKDSRRAVIDIRNSEDINASDPACLQHIQYFIRNNKLDCKVLFRSNDACKATFMNAFALILLQNKIAEELGVGIGSFVLRANSFHCYERDYDLLEGYVSRISNADSPLSIAYEYASDWKPEMESYTNTILENVESLQKRDAVSNDCNNVT